MPLMRHIPFTSELGSFILISPISVPEWLLYQNKRLSLSFDPRSYMKLGEAGLAERVKQAVSDLRGMGTSLFGSD